ncbi:uncharacterized protein EI90DRAFT_223248 [Cantharellus anzutake]|uniref:uncharacterized protein n=1 Tax=Cantharellus anzutake TaxID=1750568 RepID=UPI001903298F|nr:uncharacterized protein EI90DRAFT_223248 [Cantharellus anzutake]KAF8316690.1 hypothetical protein EI90DRAFT_223248 [Cantharellus anzutake]
MRFWNVFVPITLVLVVAADIHYGEFTCHDRGHNWMSGSWGIVPAGNDTCAAAEIIFSHELEGLRCNIYGRDIAITASLCGKNVTILLNDPLRAISSWTRMEEVESVYHFPAVFSRRSAIMKGIHRAVATSRTGATARCPCASQQDLAKHSDQCANHRHLDASCLVARPVDVQKIVLS